MLALASASPASAQYGGVRPEPTAGIPTFGSVQDQTRSGTGRGGWRVRSSLAVEETYTDNVGLAPRGAETSDWVTSVRPSVTADYLGPRARLSATYTPQLVHRLNTDTDDVYHYLNANGTAELARRLLFVDATAVATQQNISLAGPQSQSNINRTGNRTSLRSYSVSPYLRHQFGNEAQAELRYRRSTVDYSAADLSSSDSDRVDATVQSGRAYRLLTWNAAYSKERIEYRQNGQSIDFESAAVGARRLLTPTLGILGKLGYEDNNYATVGAAPRGRFWSVGPEWQPTPRTRLAATVGERFFGNTRTLDFSHRTRLTAWRLNYDEDITTARSQALIPVAADTTAFLDSLFRSAIPDPAMRETAVRTYITQTGLPSTVNLPLNYYTLTPFVQKRLLASVGLHGVRNSVLVDAYTLTRDPVSPGLFPSVDPITNTKTKQAGGNLMWTSRLSPRTSTTASIGRVRTEFAALAREDNRTDVRIALSHQLQPRMTAVVAYRRQQNQSNVSAADYRENAISVAVSMTF